MSNIATALGMDTSDAMVNAAKCFFVVRFDILVLQIKFFCSACLYAEFFVLLKIALERNFTRGRKSDQVQAACLYIACR